MTKQAIHINMIENVAHALGSDLCKKVTFVGGCTTGLLLTDTFTLEQVRFTDDVDLIVNVITYTKYTELKESLKSRGFEEPGLQDEDYPYCAMNLGNLRVDFMPDENSPVGPTNRWFSEARKNAKEYALPSGTIINLVTPEYFIATKLEAFKGRGNGDVLSSQDVEDILTVVDGREELLTEIENSPSEVKEYISSEIKRLKIDPYIDHAIQTAGNEQGRIDLIFERLEKLAGMSI